MGAKNRLIKTDTLAATPLIIRAAMPAMQPVPEANKFRQPTRPHWSAWKHVEKFTVHQAACLLENLEPSTHPKDPKISAWINALSAAIRTGKLDFIKEKQQSPNSFQEDRRARRQQQDASSTT
jgi:hypothetical protein